MSPPRRVMQPINFNELRSAWLLIGWGEKRSVNPAQREPLRVWRHLLQADGGTRWCCQKGLNQLRNLLEVEGLPQGDWRISVAFGQRSNRLNDFTLMFSNLMSSAQSHVTKIQTLFFMFVCLTSHVLCNSPNKVAR